MGEHAITTNNRATLNQDSAAEEYAALLKGRYVTDITVSSDETSATITLDNGTTLELIGSRGCSCGNGATYIREVFQQGNRTARIMNARVETTQNDERYYETDYTIFIMIDGNSPPQPCKDTTTTDTTAPGSPSTPAPSPAATVATRENRQRQAPHNSM